MVKTIIRVHTEKRNSIKNDMILTPHSYKNWRKVTSDMSWKNSVCYFYMDCIMYDYHDYKHLNNTPLNWDAEDIEQI